MSDFIDASGLKKRTWYVSRDVWEKFINILALLEFAEPNTDEYEALKDELCSLPGLPQDLAPNEYVKAEITSPLPWPTPVQH